MKRPARWLAVAAVVLAACDRDPTGGSPALDPVTLSANFAYAGAAITVRSARFAVLSDVQVWADTFQLATLARGHDSIVVRMPRDARGAYTLRLGRQGAPLGNIELAGYRGVTSVAAPLGFYLDVWPEGGAASIVAGTPDGRVVQLRPANGSITTLLTGYNVGQYGQRIPGPTPDPAVLLLQPATGALERWRMLPEPDLLDTVPTQVTRHFAQLGDSIYFRGQHHWIDTYRLRAGRFEPIYHGTYEETHEVIISPAGHRATLRVNGSVTGPPVFNTLTGDTAYHVRSLYRSYGAAFSQDGDTLWLLGATRTWVPEASDYQSALVMLDARTGTVMRQRAFDGYQVHAMRRDPQGGRLFLFAFPAGAAYDAPVDLLIVDDTSFSNVGHIEVPRGILCPGWCAHVVVAAGTDGVYLVRPDRICAFDYLRR